MAKSIQHDIKAKLLQRLRGMALDSQLPSDRDLAREFNVAFLTINRVMNDLEREGYVVRRPRKGTFLASRERTVMVGDEAAPGPNGSVMFVYPNYFSYHFWLHLRWAEELALKNGLRLVEYKLNPGSTPESAIAVAQRTEGLRGLLMLTVPSSLTPVSMDQLNALGLPVLLLSTGAAVGPYPNLHCFEVDWTRVGWLAADALLRAGHRRIAWVNHGAGWTNHIAKGMRKALNDHGGDGSDLLTIGQGIEAWEDARISGLYLAKRLLDDGQATGAYFDSIAGVRGALRVMWERGLRAPEHLSLISGGHYSGDEEYCTPPLTTIDADWEGEMRLAFAVLLGSAAPSRRIHTISVQVHERASIASPRAVAVEVKP